MKSSSDDLAKALRENLKLRRELATEVAEAKDQKLTAVRLCLARILWDVELLILWKDLEVNVSITGCRPARTSFS